MPDLGDLLNCDYVDIGRPWRGKGGAVVVHA